MTRDYRSELFETYDRHTARLDPDEDLKLRWFRGYARANYLPHIPHVAVQPSILEIGCNKGYLLASLRESGQMNLTGIDLSPLDIGRAAELVPDATFECADAMAYMAGRPESFDVVIAKAILEHVPKDGVLDFLQAIATTLRPGGVAIVDVPNMDWLFAGHERYMDFTHEVGFTRESLQQTVGAVFRDVVVVPVDGTIPYQRLFAGTVVSRVHFRLQRIRVRAARAALGTLIRWADPDGGSGPIFCRNLIAVAHI